jgi:hypothetical protein
MFSIKRSGSKSMPSPIEASVGSGRGASAR